MKISFPLANPHASFRVLCVEGSGWCLHVMLTKGWRGEYSYPRDVSRWQNNGGRGGLMLLTTRIEWIFRRSRNVRAARKLT